MRPLLSSRRGVQEYRPEGSRLRTVKWRVAESIIQSAAVLTISAVSFAVTSFVSPSGFSVCHYIFPPIVVRLSLSALHPPFTLHPSPFTLHPSPFCCLSWGLEGSGAADCRAIWMQGMVFSITVARICLSAVPEVPRPSMLEGNYGGARTMSCPSLPVTVNDVEDCSGHPIAIHVSVTHTSDRDSVMSSGHYSTCDSPARGGDEKEARGVERREPLEVRE